MDLDSVQRPLVNSTNEIIRICTELQKCVTQTAFDAHVYDPESNVPAEDDNHGTALEKAQALIRSRKNRRKYFPFAEFAEPVWDICLDLFVSQLTGRRISISSACIVADVPATTALRCLSNMQEAGLITRAADKRDKRIFYVELSKEAAAAMREYLLVEV